MLKFFSRKEIQISSFNLSKQELLDYIWFWGNNKYLTTTDFVKELYHFIDQHQLYNDCTVDMSTNEVSLSRRTII